MKLTFLGTGTSTGVPQVGCTCEVCTSSDIRDKRLRASAILSVKRKNLLIDCGPDLRTQLLTAGSPVIDAVLITHSHYDHVGGLIDLRPYALRSPLPIFCTADVAEDLHRFFPYCFVEKLYPGVPQFELHIVDPGSSFKWKGIEITPLPVMHYKLPIIGYKIGNLAYITDCKTMPNQTLKMITGIDTLVLNALRIRPHMSHICLEEALHIIREAHPRITFLTHMSDQIGLHANVKLPSGASLAYDMLTVEVTE